MCYSKEFRCSSKKLKKHSWDPVQYIVFDRVLGELTGGSYKLVPKVLDEQEAMTMYYAYL